MTMSNPVDLLVTLAALDALAAAGGHPTAQHVRAIAAPVVASYLRHLADVGYWHADVEVAQGVSRELRGYADEVYPT